MFAINSLVQLIKKICTSERAVTARMCSVGFLTPHCHDRSGDLVTGIAIAFTTKAISMLIHHPGTYTFRFLSVSLFTYALKLNTGFITSIISAESLMTSMISSMGLYAIGDSSIVPSPMLVE